MSTPVLATKLYRPPARPDVVRRPHLIERLNEGLRRTPGVTLISAAAGFGKTTLASEWAASCGRPAAWLSLDEADNDPARFLTHLVAALQTVAPDLGHGVLGTLRSPPPPSSELILTALLNEINALPDSFVLVLDDYHVIEAQSIDRALAFLVEHLPPRLQLVVATRQDPNLPLARLRARGQLTELRADELRFTLSEAAGFLNQVMDLNLSAADVAALEARTEGWIAGLQLAGISLRGQSDAAAFIGSFTGSHRFVMDYLVEEVLRQQSASVQQFLLCTSILSRLCGPLCDAVLPEVPAAGQETLEHLERANLLVVPLDDRREWYRYHHLFADVLQTRLAKERPGTVADLHRRASAWFAQNGLRPEAIRHALAAGEFEPAAELIELEWAAVSGTLFRNATWLGWVTALPEALVQRRPRLSLGYAWELLFAGELEAAEVRLRDAERSLEPTVAAQDPSEAAALAGDEKSRSTQAALALARAYQSQALGDVGGTVEQAGRVLSLVAESNQFMRGLAGSLLGLACWTNGDLEAAHRHIADAMTSLRAAGSDLYSATGAIVLADIRIAQGRLAEATPIFEEALRQAKARGGTALPVAADLHLGLSELHRELGNVEAARQHLLTAEALGEQAALPEWPYGLYLVQARVKEDEGDFDGALELLEAAERLRPRSPVPEVRPLPARKARVWIRQGRLTEVLAWVRERGLSADSELSYLREYEHVTLARAWIACCRSGRAESFIREAIDLLQRLLAKADGGGRAGSAVEILVLQALARHAQGDIPLALEPLRRALTLAESQGYVRVFVDEGGPMAELLTRLAGSAKGGQLGLSESVTRYAHRLLAALGEPQAVRSESAGHQPLIEPLSQRELEILRLIAQGLSNNEISQRLFLALSTVKGHNRSIFDKLHVQRRTEAVARARELGLV